MVNYYGNEITWVPEIEESGKPLYIRLADCIEKDIEKGRLKRGAKLPPQRVIANYLDINHSTVTRAYKVCEEKGLIKGVIGKGTFVTTTPGIPSDLLSDHKDTEAIKMGMTLPLYEINQKIEHHTKEVHDLIDFGLVLKYAPPEGHLKHRYIASQWLEKYGVVTSPDRILVTSGSQNALAIIMVTLFSKGDRIIVDEFSYTGLKSLARHLGIILVPVKSDDCGMDPGELANTCKREKIKGIYLITDCHNPTSLVMDLEKRKVISRIIDDYDLLLMEDGTFSFCVEENLPPVSSLCPENSIYIHGTSKALNPAFRISYIVSADKYVKQLRQGVNNINWMASPYTAEIVSLFQETGRYYEVARTKLDALKIRNSMADEILKGFNLLPSSTSPFRYLPLPQDYDDTEVEHLCLEAGVHVFSSKRFATGMNSSHNALRMAISSPKDEKQLKKGLEIIKDVLISYPDRFEPIV